MGGIEHSKNEFAHKNNDRTIGPLVQLNSMVSSWTTKGKATKAGSLLVFEDNVGEDGLLPSPLTK